MEIYLFLYSQISQRPVTGWLHTKGDSEWCVEALLYSCFLFLPDPAQTSMERKAKWSKKKKKNTQGEKAMRKDTNNVVLLLLISSHCPFWNEDILMFSLL